MLAKSFQRVVRLCLLDLLLDLHILALNSSIRVLFSDRIERPGPLLIKEGEWTEYGRLLKNKLAGILSVFLHDLADTCVQFHVLCDEIFLSIAP